MKIPRSHQSPLPLVRICSSRSEGHWGWRRFAVGLLAIMGILLSADRSFTQSSDPLYGQTIRVAGDASEKVVASAEALKKWLAELTGKEFSISTDLKGPGIYLTLDSAEGLPDWDLKSLRSESGMEGFLLQGENDKLWIIGRSDLAIDNGVYWYLDKLGCRWLIPSEKWTVVPKRDSIRLDAPIVEAPAFAMRDYAGTGYFGRPTIDPEQRMAKAWELNQRQNLLSAWHPDSIRLGGHVGEAFVEKYKNVLIEHPEYLAENNGKRHDVTDEMAIIKLCTSNPELQKLWIEDRVAALREALVNNPSTMTISVEPSDGGGHCDCAECKKLGTVSDQVFTLANMVAKAVAEEFPGKFVNLYAYHDHAMPPNISIEPNVIVSIVPYGFQRTGMSPEDFIVAWGKKCSNLAMYDYWNIVDWSHNLPDMSPETVADKIRFWNKNAVQYFNAESTYSGGSMGPNWFLGARLLWDPTQDVKAILDDYYGNAFGPAQAPIREMYARWGDDFILTGHELALSLRDLRKAMTLTKDPAITARLVDMGRYLHYLALWHEYLAAKPKTPERVAAAKAIVNYIWRVYDSNMLQVFRIAQLLDRDEKPELDDVHMDNPMWDGVAQLTDAEVLALVDEDIKKYQPLDFTQKSWSPKLVPLETPPTTLSETTVETQTIGFTSNFQFAVSDKITSVPLQIKVNGVSGTDKIDSIKVTGPGGEEVLRSTVANTGEWQELKIPTPAPGTYSLTVTDQKNTFSFLLPDNLPFVCTGPLTSTDLNGRTFFYVPEGTKKIAIYSTGVIPIKVIDPRGEEVIVDANENGENLFLVDVPSGDSGACWSFRGFKGWEGFRILNCPNAFAWSEDGMMVPEDLQKGSASR